MRLHTSSGVVVTGDRWLAPAGAVDARVLAGLRGPVLDVGCGPGRHVRALLERGVVALGIDVTPQLVETARARGVDALHRSVFGRVPATGRWKTALLLDGNIGIGADPEALLRRIGQLLAPGGTALVETAPPGTSEAVEEAHVELDGRRGPCFAWQAVAADRLRPAAASAGMTHEVAWQDGGRWFARLGTTAA